MADDENSIARSLGHHGHWGFSAGFDFLEALKKIDAICMETESKQNSNEPINILLIQPGDIRHILLTIARRRRHHQHHRPIHFYLFESPMELLVRDILLLEVMNDYEIPIRQRSNIFLEIFGNSKVQRRTANYMDRLSKDIIKFSAKGIGRLDHILDLSWLNYREVDSFESVLKGYAVTNPFDMQSLRDHRLRGFYAERYDSRMGLYDWDYHSLIKPKASIIHIKQFKEWRNTGIAFEFGDQRYTEPNRSMMSYTEGFLKKGKDKGIKKEIKGYWGDIICSPYFSFGIDTETSNKFAEGLFEILNKNTGTEQHRHHAVEVALYNMYSILWEIEHGTIYKMTKGNDIYSGLGLYDRKVFKDHDQRDDAELVDGLIQENEIQNEPEIDFIDEKQEEKQEEKEKITIVTKMNEKSFDEKQSERENAVINALRKAETIVETYRDIKIIPLTGTLSSLLKKTKLYNKFDSIFISSRSAQILNEEDFKKLLRQYDDNNNNDENIKIPSKCLIAVETAKFLIPLHKNIRNELIKKEMEFATALGFNHIPAPVLRRKRDENDDEDDVIFFTC